MSDPTPGPADLVKRERARVADEIARQFQASLVRDLMDHFEDQQLRNQMGAAVLSLVIRRFLVSFAYTERTRWCEELIRAILQ